MELFDSQSDFPTFTVSEITSKIKTLLQNRFGFVSITGEISNCRPASSGHLYFSLKDSQAMISAVMFSRELSRIDFIPKDGQQVTVTGNITVYEPRGSYQIRCTAMKLAGEGDLLALLEERKRKLAAEGLFDQDKKRPIPKFPKKVAVITSPTGAALQDILNVLKRRRSGSFQLQIFPAVVQGTESAATLVNRLQQINLWKCADVIIMGRGGGSIEDLLPFSDEAVVRAVAASEIPVISAVGHEIDWALSDFAADLRAPTPSAAAELVSAESEGLFNQLYQYRSSMINEMQHRISSSQEHLRALSTTELARPLTSRIQNLRMQLDHLKEKSGISTKNQIVAYKNKLQLLRQSLEENSPISLTQRGLARIRRNGEIIHSGKELSVGNQITIEWTDATAIATVNEVK